MLTRKFLVSAAALLATLPGFSGAALVALEKSLELSMRQVELPYSSTGQLTVRPCDDCDRLVLKVSNATGYHVNTGPAMELGDFRKLTAGQDSDQLILVFFKPESGEVTRVVLDLPG